MRILWATTTIVNGSIDAQMAGKVASIVPMEPSMISRFERVLIRQLVLVLSLLIVRMELTTMVSLIEINLSDFF